MTGKQSFVTMYVLCRYVYTRQILVYGHSKKHQGRLAALLCATPHLRVVSSSSTSGVEFT